MIDELLTEIKACTHCEECLPLGPRPVVSFSAKSRIAIIGQAPGTAVHASGIPWDDKSGERLREWMGVDEEIFYNPDIFAIVPMGFCYPGRGKSGDLPPRPECAPLWHERIWEQLPNVELFLLIGAYAQKYYLGKNKKKTLTATVQCFREYLPEYLPLPHPSPRNNIWLAKNEWFAAEVLPNLQVKIGELLLAGE